MDVKTQLEKQFAEIGDQPVANFLHPNEQNVADFTYRIDRLLKQKPKSEGKIAAGFDDCIRVTKKLHETAQSLYDYCFELANAQYDIELLIKVTLSSWDKIQAQVGPVSHSVAEIDEIARDLFAKITRESELYTVGELTLGEYIDKNTEGLSEVKRGRVKSRIAAIISIKTHVVLIFRMIPNLLALGFLWVGITYNVFIRGAGDHLDKEKNKKAVDDALKLAFGLIPGLSQALSLLQVYKFIDKMAEIDETNEIVDVAVQLEEYLTVYSSTCEAMSLVISEVHECVVGITGDIKDHLH